MLAFDLGVETILASAIPDAYATYRRPLTAALAFFLDHLSAERAAAIVGDQLALPPAASDAERLFALARRSPTLHKLGQILARDRRLDARLRVVLQRLESMPSDATIDELRPLIERELGDLGRAGITLEPTVVAEASIAVVVGFTWREERGVLKLLKPGVESELAEELAILDRLGTFLDERCEALGLPSLDYREAFVQVRDLLSHEVRLDGERRHLAEAAEVLGTVPDVYVPRLLPFQTPRLLSMERIEGWKVTDAHSLAPPIRRRLAATVVEALIANPVWSMAPRALFHGDPHAGNLMIDVRGRLVPLDWSLGSHLDVADRGAMARVLVGAIGRDVDSIVAALEAVAVRPPDRPTLQSVVARRIRGLAPLRPPGLEWVTGLIDEAVTAAGLRVGGHLLAFRKAILAMEGVLADVAPDFRLDRALMASLLPRLAAEWPWRAWLPPESRDLPSRVSNGDLARLALSVPGLALLAVVDRAARACARSGPRAVLDAQ
jgi:ubiquinone biosynthesis protein